MTIIYEIGKQTHDLMDFGEGWLLEYVGTRIHRINCDDNGCIRITLHTVIVLEPHKGYMNEPSQDNPNL